MNNALFELLEIKDFQDISVSELCNKAGVNRSTFYSHYDNTQKLLQETYNNFLKTFSSYQQITDLDFSNIKFNEFKFEELISDKFIIPFLKYIWIT